MTSLDSWVVAAARTLGLRADEIPADLRKGLLDLVEALPAVAGPLAGPMTGYALGLAVGRGTAPTAALTSLRDLAGEWTQQHGEEQVPEPAGPPAPGADPEVPLARAQQLTKDGRGNSTAEPGDAAHR
ncbi:MAG: DUF6457 domain-containing protein [Actinomycetota bacterium]|nr:DUF6457 domain-containing protein [Actinomycetota bacterium]